MKYGNKSLNPYYNMEIYLFTLFQVKNTLFSAFFQKNGKLSATSLAKEIGISPKAVEKHLANLKSEGIIERIGPDKGGH